MAGRPLSPYGATKVAGEALAHAHHAITGLPVGARGVLVVIGPGAHRDPRFQQRSRLGVRAAFTSNRDFAAAKRRSIVAGGDPHQQCGGVIVDVGLTMRPQQRRRLAQHRRQPLTRRRIQHCPALLQRRNNFRTVLGFARNPGTTTRGVSAREFA